jgi:hypothetical protein
VYEGLGWEVVEMRRALVSVRGSLLSKQGVSPFAGFLLPLVVHLLLSLDTTCPHPFWLESYDVILGSQLA